MQRLSRLPIISIGSIRGRARGIGADTAERYGWINRAIPDAELDDFVDRFARRIVAAGETFIRMQIWPETRSRIAKILEMGFQKPGDFELRLGHHLGIE
jgi:enoyl-CoA hydratase/carnithine racemase